MWERERERVHHHPLPHIFTFTKCGEENFSSVGLNSWKKCPQILDNHERSAAHREPVQKRLSYSQTSIDVQLVRQQAIDRCDFL